MVKMFKFISGKKDPVSRDSDAIADNAIARANAVIDVAKQYVAGNVDKIIIDGDIIDRWLSIGGGWMMRSTTSDFGGMIDSDGTNFFIKTAKAGCVLPYHYHPENDETIKVLAGKVRVNVAAMNEDRTQVNLLHSYEMNSCAKEIVLRKGTWHSITCEEDCLLFISFSPPLKFQRS